MSFTILNTILMSVLERNREFATLLALGTSPALLRSQVLIETMLIGILGCGFGLGERPSTRQIAPALNMPVLESEYGTYPHVFFMEFKFYF